MSDTYYALPEMKRRRAAALGMMRQAEKQLKWAVAVHTDDVVRRRRGLRLLSRPSGTERAMARALATYEAAIHLVATLDDEIERMDWGLTAR